uniref:Uncharacterized protein n=1 Tax=Zea mays TaxID=4577 RepID=A0A804M5I3_MAIZE
LKLASTCLHRRQLKAITEGARWGRPKGEDAEKLREKLRQECLWKGTELAHGVADALFAVSPTEDLDGPIVHLPPPAVRLPREKHLGAGTSLPGLVAAKVGADVTLTDIAQTLLFL